MGYTKDLLDKATAAAGTRYRLAKMTGLHESHLSEAAHGKRAVPASWVLPLARVAGVDPVRAMEHWDAERSAKKKAPPVVVSFGQYRRPPTRVGPSRRRSERPSAR